MLRAVLLTACVVLVASHSFIERRNYKECIEGRRSQGDLISKKDVRHCTKVAKLAADADRLALEYFAGLGDWKNGDESLSNALLRNVAPCAHRSAAIQTKWTNLYETRKDHEVAIIRASNQTWTEDVGTLTFSPTTKVDLNMLEAAELILQRRSPADLGETFGRYYTTAFLRNAHGDSERIHAGVLTSCSSTQGEIMVLDLDVAPLRDAMLDDPTGTVTVDVHVQARRQYIVGGSPMAYLSRVGHGSLLRKSRLAVVKQAIGLILHTKHNVDSVSPHLTNASAKKNGQLDFQKMITHDLANGEDVQEDADAYIAEGILVRHRRGLNPDRPNHPPTSSAARDQRARYCRRSPHRFDRELYQKMKIFRPGWNTEHFDIGLCEGRCSTPLMKTTNHAIAVANGPRGESLICCTPTSYDERPIHITLYHPTDHPSPTQVSWSQMRAQSCGCR